jgi:ABC-type transporter Mla subunit MlaD
MANKCNISDVFTYKGAEELNKKVHESVDGVTSKLDEIVHTAADVLTGRHKSTEADDSENVSPQIVENAKKVRKLSQSAGDAANEAVGDEVSKTISKDSEKALSQIADAKAAFSQSAEDVKKVAGSLAKGVEESAGSLAKGVEEAEKAVSKIDEDAKKASELGKKEEEKGTI